MLDDDGESPALKGDLADLWSACGFLGETTEEYDVEHDAVLKRFKRSEEWKDALNAVRKLLKKYHNHDRLPIRSTLHKWGILQARLLPMLQRYHWDRDFLYNLGKVLVFLTAMPQRFVKDTAFHLEILRDYKHAIVSKCPEFVPAFVSLLAPCLDPSRGEKSDQEINAVDLVLTLFKQLLEIPNPPPPTAQALGAALSIERQDLAEQCVEHFSKVFVLDAVADISRVVERREFKRLAVVLLDFWFQLYKAVDSEALHKAHRRQVAEEEAAAAKRAVQRSGQRNHGGSADDGDNEDGDGGGGLRTGGRTSPSLPAAAAGRPSNSGNRGRQQHNTGGIDVLAEIRKHENSLKAASNAASSGRHSRFGTLLVMNQFGHKQVLTSLSGGGDKNQDSVQSKGKRAKPFGGAGGSRGKNDAYEAPLTIDVAGNGGASTGGAGAGASSSVIGAIIMAAAAGSGGQARTEAVLRALYTLAMSFMSSDDEDGFEGAGSGGGGLGVINGGVIDVGDDAGKKQGQQDGADAAAENEEQEDAAPAAVSGFATLMSSIKNRFVRESDEVQPEDRLRYFHVATVLMGTYRLANMQKIKDAEDAISKRRKEKKEGKQHPSSSSSSPTAAAGAAGEVTAVPTFSADPLLPCLDRWSFTHVLTSIDDYLNRKQWQAVSIAACHLKELILTVHCLLEHGDESGKEIGRKTYDALFREREVSDIVPRLLKSYDATRFAFSTAYLPCLVEAAHYMLKMAEKAARDGLVTFSKRRSKKNSKAKTKNRGPTDGDVDNFNDGGDGGDGDDLKVNVKAARSTARKERAFEFEKYASEYCHPSVIQAYIACLSGYRGNGPKLNYYATHFLRRIAGLPNDAASGSHPTTGKPFTFLPMLYNVEVLDLATDILNDKAINVASAIASNSSSGGGSGSSSGANYKIFADVCDWARSLSSSFLRDSAENPLLFVEALFWRPEKGQNADLARHYGILDGNLMAGDGGDGIGPDGKKLKRKSKAAIAADEAEAETRRMAAAMRGSAAASGAGADGDENGAAAAGAAAGVDDEGDAQVDFDASSDDDGADRRRRMGKLKKLKAKGKKGKRRGGGSDSDSDSSSSSDSSSGSSSSSSSSDDSGRRQKQRSNASQQPHQNTKKSQYKQYFAGASAAAGAGGGGNGSDDDGHNEASDGDDDSILDDVGVYGSSSSSGGGKPSGSSASSANAYRRLGVAAEDSEEEDAAVLRSSGSGSGTAAAQLQDAAGRSAGGARAVRGAAVDDDDYDLVSGRPAPSAAASGSARSAGSSSAAGLNSAKGASGGGTGDAADDDDDDDDGPISFASFSKKK